MVVRSEALLDCSTSVACRITLEGAVDDTGGGFIKVECSAPVSCSIVFEGTVTDDESTGSLILQKCQHHSPPCRWRRLSVYRQFTGARDKKTRYWLLPETVKLRPSTVMVEVMLGSALIG